MQTKTFIFLFLLFSFASFGQDEKAATHKSARRLHTDGDFKTAFDHYKELLQNDPMNVTYNFNAAMAILDGNFKAKGVAIYYLEKIKEEEDLPYTYLLELGKAYHHGYKFHKALHALNDFYEISKDEYLNEEACRYIEYSSHALDLVKNPVSVKIENMGDKINSEEPDYYPFIDEDETYMLFSTRRNKGNGGYEMIDGFKSADIFISKVKRGEFGRSRTIGGMVTTGYDEEIVGLSRDGEYLFVNLDNMDINGEIMISKRKGRQYQKPKLLGEMVNTPFMEVTATVPKNKEILYFSSTMPGGYGGADLYISKLLPTGEYSLPENMGPKINTYYDEFFPMLSSDEKTFYFSSEGHHGMGGFDIFYCDWNEKLKQWGSPKNIGYPINTPDHDMQICYTKDKRVGYLSSLRSGSIGDLDIWSVTHIDVDPKQTAIVGELFANATVDYNDYITFHYYKKDSLIKRFTDDFLPPDDSWEFVKDKKKIVKPGKEYRVTLVYEKDGIEKRCSIRKAPINDPSYQFKNIKVIEIPKKNYTPKKGSKPKETPVIIATATIEVTDLTTGNLAGIYKPTNKGKFVLILHPGSYEVKIDLEGFQPFAEKIKIYGKGDYKQIIKRDFQLIPTNPLEAVNYSDVKKSQK